MGCKKCGRCCKFMTFTVTALKTDRMIREYYKAHGCKVNGDKVIIPMRCPHLTGENECDIHENKPMFCRLFKGKQTERFEKPEGCEYD